jgi:MoaA/NifB/PqqE/SkfB family radical SAM enzyme
VAVSSIGFHLTDRCQLDCQHCLRDPAQKPQDLELELVRRVLAESKKVYRTNHAIFTGGEPTLHPDFEELVAAAVELGMSWSMVSNARRFPSLLEKLSAHPARVTAMFPNFSLDGAAEATHDAIRGKGSFRDVMSAASVCVAEAIPFAIQMVVNAKNVLEIEAMGLLASQLGAAELSFGMLQPTGTSHDASLFISARGWRTVQERMERLAGMLKLKVSTPEGFWREQLFHVCSPFASEQLHVDLQGRLSLCCQHSGIPSVGEQDVAGDLHTMSLAEAHRALLGIIHGAQARRLTDVARGELTEWDHFPCNSCMKSFGKPYWTEEGASGPEAKRERWRGAFGPRRLPILA